MPVIRIRKDLGPVCFWSHGQSFSGKFYYTQGVVLLPSSQLWSGLDLLELALTLNQGSGGPKQGLERIYSLNRETRQNFYKTEVVVKIYFSGGGLYFGARNPDLEGHGPHVLL